MSGHEDILRIKVGCDRERNDSELSIDRLLWRGHRLKILSARSFSKRVFPVWGGEENGGLCQQFDLVHIDLGGPPPWGKSDRLRFLNCR